MMAFRIDDPRANETESKTEEIKVRITSSLLSHIREAVRRERSESLSSWIRSAIKDKLYQEHITEEVRKPFRRKE